MKLSFELARSSSAPIPGLKHGSQLTPPLPTMHPGFIRAMREIEELNEKMKRSYDAGMSDNYNADFRQTYGSANTELLQSKYKVRGRTRTLGKDTPHGKAIKRTFQNNVVGDEPFKLEMMLGEWDDDGNFKKDQKKSKAIELAWSKFCKKKNFTVRKNMSAMEAGRMIEAELIEAGSVLGRHHRDYQFNEFGYAVDFLEEDRLQESYIGKSPSNGKFGGGNPIRFSIEYHPKYNFPLAYWILLRHPGEVISPTGLQNVEGTDNWREQVPARDIIHINNLRDRAEQDVGMTELDAIVQPLWRNQQYSKSLAIAALMSTMKPFVLEKKFPTGIALTPEMAEMIANGEGGPAGKGQPNTTMAQQGNGTPTQTMRPGMERELPYGVEAKILDPKFPIEAAHDYRNDNLREIAVGVGASYQHVSGDFQNLGFTAALMCQTPFQDHCKVRQKNIIDGGWDAIFAEWLMSAIKVGYFDKRGEEILMSEYEKYVDAALFKGRRWPFVNPLVQAQALVILNEAGHLTRQQVQDLLPEGLSFESLVQSLKNEKNILTENGLDYSDIDATRPAAGNGEPKVNKPEGGDDGQPPSKTKLANPVRHKVSMDSMLLMSESKE